MSQENVSQKSDPKKVAVVLMNLGGPDQMESIEPFLFNFFMDKNIIGAPLPIRYFIAKMISKRRSKGEALEAYSALGGKSPLLENTQLQRQALERSLNNEQKEQDTEFKCFVTMRYWHPMAAETVKAVQGYAPDHVILIPLYPQFSTATSYSSYQAWYQACRKLKYDPPMASVCCYPFDEGFLQASADLVAHAYTKAVQENPNHKIRVLFSAHGLPEVTVKRGDPYQWQCEQGAAKMAAATGISDLDWQICYQSRVGPLKWIGPSTEEALEQASKDGVGVLIYPHAFVSEHVETLVEIEEEYREVAQKLGVKSFDRVPTVSTHPKFIVGLKKVVLDLLDKQGILSPEYTHDSICPSGFKNCCQRRQPK